MKRDPDFGKCSLPLKSLRMMGVALSSVWPEGLYGLWERGWPEAREIGIKFGFLHSWLNHSISLCTMVIVIFFFFCHYSFIWDSENIMDGETALYNISDMFFLGEESWRIVKELESTDISLYLYYTSEERGTTWSWEKSNASLCLWCVSPDSAL